MTGVMEWGVPLGAVLVAYALGSVSFAVVVSRVMGLSDPRTYGSHNPGATNVLRSGNKGAAVATLLLDALKGWLPVWCALTWGSAWGLGDLSVAAVALAAFVGHLAPVFFGFKGGKGVATAAGVLFGVSPWLGLVVLGSWLLVAWVSRYSSLAALVAALVAPAAYLLGSGGAWWSNGPMTGALVAMSAGLVWRHTENINRLIAGKESKLGQKKKGSAT